MAPVKPSHGKARLNCLAPTLPFGEIFPRTIFALKRNQRCHCESIWPQTNSAPAYILELTGAPPAGSRRSNLFHQHPEGSLCGPVLHPTSLSRIGDPQIRWRDNYLLRPAQTICRPHLKACPKSGSLLRYATLGETGRTLPRGRILETLRQPSLEKR